MRAFHSFESHFNRFHGKTGRWLGALLGTAAIGCFTLLELPAPARAQDGYAELAGKASASVAAKAPQAASLKKKMDEQIAENEQTKKEYDKKFDELRSYDGPLADYKRDLAAYEADLATYEAANNSYKSRLADYDSRCTQPPDDATYNACVGEYGNLSAEHGGIDATFSSLNGRHSTLNSHSSALNQKVDALTAELDNYANRMKANFASWEANKKALDQLSSELDGLRTLLVNFCGSVEQIQNTDDDALEAMKHCASLGWDGTNRTLPPLAIWIENSSGGWRGISASANN